jgi:hypothetical protein
MDKLVQLISALAWPATVLSLAMIFRHELRRAASRLSSLQYKDFKAGFERDLKRLEGEVQALPAEVRVPTDAPASENKAALSSYDRLVRIAEISPRAAIMEAWRDIEVTTKKVADAHGLSVDGAVAGVKAIRDIVGRGLLPRSVIGVYEQMRRLRARAAHAADFAIDSEEAERYIDTAHKFYVALLFLLKQIDGQERSGK